MVSSSWARAARLTEYANEYVNDHVNEQLNEQIDEQMSERMTVPATQRVVFLVNDGIIILQPCKAVHFALNGGPPRIAAW